jgi:hypothetical protein
LWNKLWKWSTFVCGLWENLHVSIQLLHIYFLMLLLACSTIRLLTLLWWCGVYRSTKMRRFGKTRRIMFKYQLRLRGTVTQWKEMRKQAVAANRNITTAAEAHNSCSLAAVQDSCTADSAQNSSGSALRWLPPPVGEFKFNIDATLFQEEHSYGVGTCIRNSRGHFMELVCTIWQFNLMYYMQNGMNG